MKTKDLAELLDTTPVKITEKSRSTNKLTAVMSMALLEMPKDLVEPYIQSALANFSKVEDKVTARRKKALERANSIKNG